MALLKETLQTMEDSNHIQRVRDPTEWVNNTVLVVKPGGSLRICLDPTELNKCLKREHYVLQLFKERRCYIVYAVRQPCCQCN